MIRETTFRNLPALQLSDGDIRLTIIPQWGGKIWEILDLRRSREWLFTREQLPDRLPSYGAEYNDEFDVGGFDECFPTVGACAYPSEPWRGTPLPDHGEVWSIPWQARPSDEAIQLTTHGTRLSYRLEKSIRLLGAGRIRLDYRATNLTSDQMSFLWSSHPVFAVEPGMRLDLPVEEMRVYSAPAFEAEAGSVFRWPRHESVDLSTVPSLDAGIAAKLFSRRVSEGWAEITDPSDGAAFRFEFEPAVVTHLGLWLNYTGWSASPGTTPGFSLALEPCIGAPDALDTAVVDWREHGTLPAHGALDWWLEISLS